MKLNTASKIGTALFTGVLALFVSFVSVNTVSAAESGKGRKIGIMWVGKSGMTNRVFDGLQKQLNAKVPEMDVEVIKELGTEEEAATIYERWLKEKNGIVFLRSSGAEFLGKKHPSIPSFVGGCNNPVNLGALKNLDKPEGNITGVTYYLKPIQHLKLYKQIFPRLKSVGLLVEEGHPGTPIDQEGTKAACQEMGIEYNEAVISNKDDMAAKVKELSQKVDLFIIGNSSLVIDNAAIISDASGGKPVASYAEAPVTTKNALVGLVPSDEKLGRMLGDSVVDIVVNGKSVKDVPVKMDDQANIFICTDKIKQWKVKVPLNVLKISKIVK